MERIEGHGDGSETVRGQVEETTDQGIKVAGRWWHYGHDSQVAHPARGQIVEVTAADSIIVKLALLAAPEGAESGPAGEAAAGPLPAPATPPGKDTVATRLALVEAASMFLAHRPKATASDVLVLAETWEAWVLREQTG
jgi:hypothetical protein